MRLKVLNEAEEETMRFFLSGEGGDVALYGRDVSGRDWKIAVITVGDNGRVEMELTLGLPGDLFNTTSGCYRQIAVKD